MQQLLLNFFPFFQVTTIYQWIWTNYCSLLTDQNLKSVVCISTTNERDLNKMVLPQFLQRLPMVNKDQNVSQMVQ